MISRDITPAPELQDFIYRYRLRHFRFENGRLPTPKPFPPRPEQCIIFYPRGSERIENAGTGDQLAAARSIITGQFTQRVNRFITTPEFLMISVEFKPGVLYRFTGISFSDLTNKCLDAEAVFTTEMAAVNSRLSSATSYPEMICIIELYLTELAARAMLPGTAVDAALNALLDYETIPTVDTLAKNAFLGARQLERKLSERMGVCPKTFLKLSRFHRSLKMRMLNKQLSWQSIALQAGYSDYQHLVKDYKIFTLNTPKLFLQEEFSAPGRVLGLSHFF